jgi:hypothetical protein
MYAGILSGGRHGSQCDPAKRRMGIEERKIVKRDLEISADDVLPTRLACSALDILRNAKNYTLFDAASYV